MTSIIKDAAKSVIETNALFTFWTAIFVKYDILSEYLTLSGSLCLKMNINTTFQSDMFLKLTQVFAVQISEISAQTNRSVTHAFENQALSKQFSSENQIHIYYSNFQNLFT